MNSAYRTKLPADPQKLRGGYYTPAPVAEFLIKWAVRTGKERVLEPSCGDGNFLVPLIAHVHTLLPALRSDARPRVVAVEVEPSELERAQVRVNAKPSKRVSIEWIGGDFFQAYPILRQPGFDVVIGNPPFIRFQYFEEESREVAFGHLRDVGYKPTKLANAWAAFVQLSIELLKSGGRLAMVLPAELLQVQYAHELRARIVSSFEHVVIIGFRRLIFPEIQQEVVLLLAEGKPDVPAEDCDIHTIDISDAAELDADVMARRISHTPARHSRVGMKWTALYLTEAAYKAIDRAQGNKRLTALGKLASVDVGIVTGLNAFFVVDDDRAKKVGAEKLSVPIIGKTGALKSILFGTDDFAAYRRLYPSRLLNLAGVPTREFPKKLLAYIKHGESEGAHTGYKCRIRKRWADVPSVYTPDAFLFRQIHSYPLLVLNGAGATSTDTIHRVRLKAEIDGSILSACFVNSLTFAWAEVAGRSYGGGVLELEPREAEELPVPYFADLVLDVEHIDKLLRGGEIDAALDYVDSRTLVERLGFSLAQTRAMRNAWRELSNRRISRK